MTAREPMLLAVAQPALVSHDVAANAMSHAGALRRAGARVVAFPEMSLTGYELEAPPIASDDVRLAPIVEACRETGSLALVGAPVRDADGKTHIAMLAIDGDGARVVYRKVHLHGTEAQWFDHGPGPVAIEVDGWRLGLAICRDTGIAEHVTGTAALGIDVFVAGVLDNTPDFDVQEERSRRIAADRGVWVAVASFAGSTGGGFDHAAGRSSIRRPGGEVVARAGADAGAVVGATLT